MDERHRHYYGGAQVDLFFKLIDTWRTLRYKDGEQQVVIPSETTVVTYLPGSREELKPGSVVFVPAANSQPDGTLLAQRVMVGRNVAPPQ